MLKALDWGARRTAFERFLERLGWVESSGREVEGEGGTSPKMKNLMNAKMMRAMVSWPSRKPWVKENLCEERLRPSLSKHAVETKPKK